MLPLAMVALQASLEDVQIDETSVALRIIYEHFILELWIMNNFWEV